MAGEREFDWKQIPGKLKKAFGCRVGNDSILDGVVSTGKPESKRKSSTRNFRRKSKTDESQDLPLASVSFTYDMADEKVLFILGRTGLGFRKQQVHGYLCFIKTISPEHAGSEPVEELMHEAEIYMFLQSLWGVAVPSVVFYGRLEDGKFALITTEEGESIADVEVRWEDRIHVRKCAHDALEQIHSIGIFHGDVALRNFVVDVNCNIKVIDFGRARRLDPRDPKFLEWLTWSINNWTRILLHLDLNYLFTITTRNASLPKNVNQKPQNLRPLR